MTRCPASRTGVSGGTDRSSSGVAGTVATGRPRPGRWGCSGATCTTWRSGSAAGARRRAVDRGPGGRRSGARRGARRGGRRLPLRGHPEVARAHGRRWRRCRPREPGPGSGGGRSPIPAVRPSTREAPCPTPAVQPSTREAPLPEGGPPPECVPESLEPCGASPAVGRCRQGQRSCGADGRWGPCQGEIGPLPEECNGVDDDCNGAVDDACACHLGLQYLVDNDRPGSGYREERPDNWGSDPDYSCHGTYRYLTRGSGDGSRRGKAIWQPAVAIAGSYRVVTGYRASGNRTTDADYLLHDDRGGRPRRTRPASPSSAARGAGPCRGTAPGSQPTRPTSCASTAALPARACSPTATAAPASVQPLG